MVPERQRLEKQVSDDPADYDAHYALGLLLGEQFKDYDSARLEYERAFEIKPKNLEI